MIFKDIKINPPPNLSEIVCLSNDVVLNLVPIQLNMGDNDLEDVISFGNYLK